MPVILLAYHKQPILDLRGITEGNKMSDGMQFVQVAVGSLIGILYVTSFITGVIFSSALVGGWEQPYRGEYANDSKEEWAKRLRPKWIFGLCLLVPTLLSTPLIPTVYRKVVVVYADLLPAQPCLTENKVNCRLGEK